MKILDVKLRLNGLKGLIITYDRADNDFAATHTSKFKKPVQGEVKMHFGDLAPHFVKILGLLDGTEVHVTGASKSVDGDIVLSGSVRSAGVDKHYQVVTPVVKSEDGYDGYSELETIVTNLYETAQEYATSKKQLNNKQLLLDFATQTGKLAFEDIESMDEEAQLKKAREILEKNGCLVFESEEAPEGVSGEETTVEWPEVDEAHEDPFATTELAMRKVS